MGVKNKKNKYISKTGQDRYRIVRNLNGKSCYFGAYDTIEEAIIVRDAIECAGWLKCEANRPRYSNPLPKYIRYNRNGYQVFKRLNGKIETFGTFHNLEDAVNERDYLVNVDWNLDLLVEVCESSNKIIWLNREVYV